MNMQFARKKTSLPYASDDYRSYLIHRNAPPIVHRSAEHQFKRLRALSLKSARVLGQALHRFVRVIQDIKMRRVERELRMHGISCKWADEMTPLGTPKFNRPE